MHFTETEILGMVAAFMWPFMRISAMFITVPVFSIRSVPARIRLILSVAMTLLITPLLPPLPDIEPLSYAGIMVSVQQLLIGVVSGFIVQLVFAAVVFGGQGIAFSMGLGFAAMIDPQSGQQVPVVSQFFVIASTLIFLGTEGHLLLIEMILDSFNTLPIDIYGLDAVDIWALISWSSRLFAGGLLLALPVIASLLLVNISFGVATRAAPQLNIFSVGFPVTLMLGLVLIWGTLPNVLGNFTILLTDAYGLIGQLLRL